MNLLNLLMGSMTNDSSLNALAGKTGLSGGALKKLMTAAIPMLLKFLTKNAGSAAGAQSLLTALGGHKDTRSMADQIKEADAEDGSKILGHIFGNEKDQIVSTLAKEAEMDDAQAASALSNMAPALMSGLSAATTSASKVDLSDGLDLTDLMGMFGGGAPAEKAEEASGLLGGLGGLFGGGKSSGIGSLLGGLFGGGDDKEEEKESALDGMDLLGSLSSLLK